MDDQNKSIGDIFREEMEKELFGTSPKREPAPEPEEKAYEPPAYVDEDAEETQIADLDDMTDKEIAEKTKEMVMQITRAVYDAVAKHGSMPFKKLSIEMARPTTNEGQMEIDVKVFY